MAGVLRAAVGKRASGDKPSPLQAVGAAMVAGCAVAALTYKLMRA